MKSQIQQSIPDFLSKEALRWCLKGFLIACAVSAPLITYYVQQYVERQTVGISDAAARAFRPKIISGNIRFAEDEMRSAFKLQDGERLFVRDSKFEFLYPHNKTDSDYGMICQSAQKVCWSKTLRTVSYIVPIYYDSDGKELFGYLEYVGHPSIDPWLVFSLFILMGGGFLFLCAGLYFKIKNSSKVLSDQISDWSEQIEKNPRGRLASDLPIAELSKFQETISHLDGVITNLEVEAEKRGKNEVIRGLAHDLLKPTSQVKKWVFALLKGIEQRGSVDAEVVKELQKSLNRLTDYANQIKSLRSDLVPIGELRNQIIDANVLIAEIMTSFQNDPEVKRRRIKLQSLSNISDAKKIVMSPEDFRRITENLLTNAIHATNDDGQITISIQQNENNLEISIADNGCGIADDIRDHIFDLDFTTKPISGTGLGLPIVKQLCESYGGKINYKSQIGEGTTFTLSFNVI